MRLVGVNLERAVRDAGDFEARSAMMYAATLAGIAFGNAGVHVPHGMSYAVAGLARDFCPHGYPQGAPLVPHGMSVIVNSPAVFRFTASACPERHLHGAQLLGADVRDALPEDSGEVLAEHLVRLMRATHMPNGLSGIGYTEHDIELLSAGAYLQQRLLKNAPRPISRDDLKTLFGNATAYW